MNQRLVDALQIMKERVYQVKEKYRSRVPKSCASCGVQIGARRGASNASSFVGGDDSEIDGIDFESLAKKAGVSKKTVYTEYSDSHQSYDQRPRNNSATGA